ncbi:hypothetical protein E3N88_03932 [Mikania micrantha]|uniref:Uncharacterized protein n=1 Tax=Mikania micrantha TaxID=192012 RepID=A0A5N6PSX7_9ASTR|nr:hypothetical protein E3N88_03932 [Mikania micrantha]
MLSQTLNGVVSDSRIVIYVVLRPACLLSAPFVLQKYSATVFVRGLTSKVFVFVFGCREESSEAVSLRKPLVLQKLYVFRSSEALTLSVGLPKCLSCAAFSRSELPFGSNVASEEEHLPSEGCLSV